MKNKNSISIFVVCLLISLTIYSCSKSSGTTGTVGNGGNGGTGGIGGTTVSVDINGMTYNPSTVTVKVGIAVKWTNSDYYSAHTVTSDNGTTFNSGNIAIGSSFTYSTKVAGTFPYHCTIHGAAMAGTLVVTP